MTPTVQLLLTVSSFPSSGDRKCFFNTVTFMTVVIRAVVYDSGNKNSLYCALTVAAVIVGTVSTGC